MSNRPAPLGFVVIGRNEGERLIRCLDSLIGEGNFEIVYVDSGSTDNSVAEAGARGVHVVKLDLARPFTAGRARNEGFAALTAQAPQIEFVQFIDGDCELAPTWLDAAKSFLDVRTDVAVVCGRRQERDPHASVYNRLCDIEWNTPVGEAEACGGDALVRAVAFAEIDGFSGQLIAGEEPELCHRLRDKGWKIWRLDVAMTLHDAAMYKLSQWWMRGVRSGFGYTQVWNATRDCATPLYRTELLRVLAWAGFLPLAIFAAFMLWPFAGVAMVGLYPLQVVRIAFRRGVTQADSWNFGFFAVLAKFPEFFGAAKFFLAAFRGRDRHAILYK